MFSIFIFTSVSIGPGNLQRQSQWQPKVAPIRELSRNPGSNQNSRFNSRDNHAKGSIDSLNNIQEGDFDIVKLLKKFWLHFQLMQVRKVQGPAMTYQELDPSMKLLKCLSF
jgi:hypothetical protein